MNDITITLILNHTKKNTKRQTLSVSRMTLAELKSANSIYLGNYFMGRSITRNTASKVKHRLVIKRSDIYTW